MADVARAAGVSQQTVSRVANGLLNVNEQTRQRVQAAMQELVHILTGLSRSTVSSLYNDKATRIDFDTLEKLCRLFECSAGELFEVCLNSKVK